MAPCLAPPVSTQQPSRYLGAAERSKKRKRSVSKLPDPGAGLATGQQEIEPAVMRVMPAQAALDARIKPRALSDRIQRKTAHFNEQPAPSPAADPVVPVPAAAAAPTSSHAAGAPLLQHSVSVRDVGAVPTAATTAALIGSHAAGASLLQHSAWATLAGSYELATEAHTGLIHRGAQLQACVPHAHPVHAHLLQFSACGPSPQMACMPQANATAACDVQQQAPGCLADSFSER